MIHKERCATLIDNNSYPSTDTFKLPQIETSTRTSIDIHPKNMVGTLVQMRDENGDLHDQEGHLCNAAANAQDVPDYNVHAAQPERKEGRVNHIQLCLVISTCSTWKGEPRGPSSISLQVIASSNDTTKTVMPPASPIEDRGMAIPIEHCDQAIPERLRLCVVTNRKDRSTHRTVGAGVDWTSFAKD
ncbi:hypothetical protein DY000_02031213 [Brassica cretica]|uniref:Uncharacterized protein n=1 Tax=Brassica cretica TaxID=69181 RepID=A0ABQ7DUQ2_BRACR|nr:hypothetical protein DY000_02031213 [Brassica cretica]